MRHFCKTLGIISIVLLYCATASAQKITANPNPVQIPKGQTEKETTISWDAGPEHEYCEIFISVNGGEASELARGHNGSKAVTVQAGSKYDFTMVVYSDDQGGNPRTIANLTVTGQPQPETPPKGAGVGGLGKVGIINNDKLAGVVPCILDIKVEHIKETSFFVSFTTREPVYAEVRIEKWGSYAGGKEDWLIVNSESAVGSGSIVEEGVTRAEKDHRFRIGLIYEAGLIRGNKYRLQLTASTYTHISRKKKVSAEIN